MFWIFETLTSKTCHCTKWLFSVAVAWWAGRVAWCNSSYQLLFLSFWFLDLFFFFVCFSNLKNVDGIIWTGNFKSIPCRARPFLLSYWIAVSVTRLEMGIYYDSMTPKEKKIQKEKNKKKLEKKIAKEKCGEGWQNIYRWVIWVCKQWLWR